jgi:hypothetical protein
VHVDDLARAWSEVELAPFPALAILTLSSGREVKTGFGFSSTSVTITFMPEVQNKLPGALKHASEEGIDLSQLYERRSLTPTERLQKHFRMAAAIDELRKAGQRHRDRNRPSETA